MGIWETIKDAAIYETSSPETNIPSLTNTPKIGKNLHSQTQYKTVKHSLDAAIYNIEHARRQLGSIENLCELTIGDVAGIAYILHVAVNNLEFLRKKEEQEERIY